MKYIANFFRIFVGLLFIFSGLIKSNDPTGFSYKLDEYFSVFAGDMEADQDSMQVRINYGGEQSIALLPLSAQKDIYTIVAATSDWLANPMDPVNGKVDTLYSADATLYAEGKELMNVPINSLEGDSILLSVTIQTSIQGKSLKSSRVDFVNRVNTASTLSIDAAEYLHPNSWIVDFLQGMRPYALALAIFLCILEIVLGIALLIGWSPKFVVTLLILLIVFFTFLTWYSAYYDKVTDCGCFGDAIKLTPWESFYKDVVLSVSIFFITVGIRYIKPVFSKPFAVRLLTVFTLLSVSFSLYCWHYLPVKNFLKFKEGNNIKDLAVVPEGAPTDVYENVFIYAKGGVEEEFSLAEMSGRDLKKEGYIFVDRKDKLISKGYEPEIHDFKIMDESRNNDYADDFFANDTAHKILIVINEVAKANADAMADLKKIIKTCQENSISIYPLTASSADQVEIFRHEYQLAIPFYYGDKTNLKSIIRSNPGLVLFEGNVVKCNWPSTRLPSAKRFLKKVNK